MDTEDDIPLYCELDFAVHDELRNELRERSTNEWRRQAEASLDQSIKPSLKDDWMVMSLVAPCGDVSRTDPGLPGEEYAATTHLEGLPAFRNLLDKLPCEVMAVRLMKLCPGAQVEPHTDAYFGLAFGKVRLHIPIFSNPKAMLVWQNTRVHWRTGRLWFGDFSRQHTVINDGPDDRIHLVLDCILSPELLRLFPRSMQDCSALFSRKRLMRSAHAPPSGDWLLRVSTRAFDWADGAHLDTFVDHPLSIGDRGEIDIDLPSGVRARLWPVGDQTYRVGAMPEECTVVLDQGSSSVVRRGHVTRIFQASLLPR